MTATSTDFRPTPAVTPMSPVVAVIAEHDHFDAALVAFVNELGFTAVLHDVDSPGARTEGYPVVVLTRSRLRFGPLMANGKYRLATIVGVSPRHHSDGEDQRLVVSEHGARQLRTVFAEAATRFPRLANRERPGFSPQTFARSRDPRTAGRCS